MGRGQKQGMRREPGGGETRRDEERGEEAATAK